MDSTLLNLFHDDPFDGNYVKYESNDFWTNNNNDIMGLQLTETLHGILPMEPSEVSEFPQDHKDNDMLMYNEGLLNESVDHLGIITVDPDAICTDTDSEDYTNSDHSSNNEIEFNNHNSRGSDLSFRTRTDSSSIGDYESHLSDYENDDVSIDTKEHIIVNTNLCDDEFNLSEKPKEFGQKRTVSINTNFSDLDGLGLQIDPNNFDLAEFITKDDFDLDASEHSSMSEIINKPTDNDKNQIDSDAESDIIVDVETVECEDDKSKLIALLNTCEVDNRDDMVYQDDVEGDPSWDPSQKKKNDSNMKMVKSLQSQKNKNNSHQMKRKANNGKGKGGILKRNLKSKLISTQKLTPVKCKEKAKLPPDNVIKLESLPTKPTQPPVKSSASTDNFSPEQQTSELPKAVEKLPESSKPPVVKRKLNLEEYKRRRALNNIGNSNEVVKTNSENTLNSYAPSMEVPSNPVSPIKHTNEVKCIVKTLKEQSNQKTVVDPITEAKNKVLRMQQLKKAQQIRIIDSTVSSKVPRVTKLPPLKDIVKNIYSPVDSCEKKNVMGLKIHPDYEEIIIVSVGCNTDISLAPNQNISFSSRSILKSSVLLYSISNTVKQAQAAENVKISNSSLISSIQDVVVKKTASTMIKHNMDISTSTIAQTQTPVAASKTIKKEDNESEPHGEDMIIMHLRKDRIRKRMVCTEMQTDMLPEFPPLQLILPAPTASTIEFKTRGRNRNRSHLRKRRSSSSDSNCSSRSSSTTSSNRSEPHSTNMDSCASCTDHNYVKTTKNQSGRRIRRRRYSSSSSDGDSDSSVKNYSNYKRHHSRRSSSRSSSTSTWTDYSNRSRSRSRSPCRSRFQKQGKYNKNNNNNNNSNYGNRNLSQPAVEERRIVYVGRIEEQTTKEILKRKFSVYGNIKQVSIHYKDNGMKYGFVTYQRSEDAFAAIDNGMRNSEINMYDISFGGRRAFCRASYADLDNAGINTYQSYVYPTPVSAPKNEESFEDLLLKVKAKLSSNKPSNTNGGNSSKI